jgi:hypothetical protein
MPKVFIVQGDHFHVPGRAMSAHVTPESAARAAASLVDGLFAWIEEPEDAKPETWEADLLRARNARAVQMGCKLVDLGDDDGDVWITELECEGIGEPVGWVYELAGAINPETREYLSWSPRLQFSMPNVPSGAVRKLRPLYAGEEMKS